MRIVHDKDVPFKVTATKHREPNIEFKRLLQGVPGSKHNYEFSLARSPGRFKSPRHRHNFDQIRLCLEGRFGDGKDLDLHPGQVGYYGEGTYYSIDSTDSLVVLLQFGGANGDGFTHYSQLFRAYEEMIKLGEFRDGVFYRHQRSNLPPGVKANQDGYEALWQHIHGKPVVYPKPRYPNPVIMNPDNAGWLADPDQPGVERCTLGIFTERLIEIAMAKVAAGSAFIEAAPRAPRLFYILEGEATLDDGQALHKGTAIELSAGEEMRGRATADLRIYAITLPFFTATELAEVRETAATAVA